MNIKRSQLVTKGYLPSAWVEIKGPEFFEKIERRQPDVGPAAHGFVVVPDAHRSDVLAVPVSELRGNPAGEFLELRLGRHGHMRDQVLDAHIALPLLLVVIVVRAQPRVDDVVHRPVEVGRDILREPRVDRATRAEHVA